MSATWHEFPPLGSREREVDGAFLAPDAGVQSTHRYVEAVRAPLAPRQFVLRRVLLGGHVLRKEGVPIAFTLLFPREGGLAAGVEIDGVVASEWGESHGG